MSSAVNATAEITRPEYAELIAFARGIYSGTGIFSGKNRVALVKNPEPGHEQFALCAVLKDIMRKSLWRFIVHSGGFRKTEVLAGDEPVYARIWDRFVAPDNPLTVTRTSLEILVSIFNHTRQGNKKNLLAEIENLKIAGFGDALLLHVAILVLLRHGGKDLAEGFIEKSPLTRITHYNIIENPGACPDFITGNKNQIYFWYLIEHIVDCWLEIENEKPESSIDNQMRILERQKTLFEKLFDWFAPAYESGRECGTSVHLLEVIIRFYGKLIDRAGGADGILTAVAQAEKKLSSNREKEDYRRLWSDIFEPGRRLGALNLEIAERAARLEATPSEQFFAKRYHAYASKYGKPVLSIVSALRGEIGSIPGRGS